MKPESTGCCKSFKELAERHEKKSEIFMTSDLRKIISLVISLDRFLVADYRIDYDWAEFSSSLADGFYLLGRKTGFYLFL